MTNHLLPEIGSSPASTIGGAPAARPASSDSVNFRRLLESIEKLAADHRRAPPAQEVQDPDQLHAAIERADAGFTTAMDLRRQLEAAFRTRQQ